MVVLNQGISHRPTHAVINLEHYRRNLRGIQRRIGKQREIIAIIKANAYGHGMVQCAWAAKREGIKWLGIATVDEALCLRHTRGFANSRLLILGPTFPEDADVLVDNKIDVAVGSLDVARALDRSAKKAGVPARTHLKADTGMGRFGFWFEDVPDTLSILKEFKHLRWKGVMTHFSESDVPSFSYTQWQLKNFKWLLEQCAARNFQPEHIHAANSGAVLQHPDAFYDLVRPGIMTYGLLPDHRCKETVTLRPVLTLLTKIIDVRTFPKGRFLSYGRTFKTKRRTRAGLLPMGYGDGYPRHLSNKGFVMVHGKKARVIGRVCMDQVLIDITNNPRADVGSEVVVYGKKGKNYVPLEEIAKRIGTITYELTCRLTPRVPRHYIDNK